MPRSSGSVSRRSIWTPPRARHTWLSRAAAMPTSGVKWSRCSRTNNRRGHSSRGRCSTPPRRTLSTSGLLGDAHRSLQVVSLLGSGGMGDVYRARDTQLGRDVAIKVAAAGLPERSGTTRPIPSRGSRARVDEPSAHRRDLWCRAGTGWKAGAGAGARRGPHARGTTARVERAPGFGLAGRRGAGDCVTDRDGARSRPREGDRPPRPQAREYQADRRRNREGARFRAGQGGRDRRRRGRSIGCRGESHSRSARSDPM